MPGYSFDVGTVLGIGSPKSSPMPIAGEDEVILRVNEPLSYAEFQQSQWSYIYIELAPWVHRFDWATKSVEPGQYALRIPMSGSKGKTFHDQVVWGILSGATVAPITLVAASLLCIRVAGGADPLMGGWVRCAEQSAEESHCALTWHAGRLCVVGRWDDDLGSDIMMAACRAIVD